MKEPAIIKPKRMLYLPLIGLATIPGAALSEVATVPFPEVEEAEAPVEEELPEDSVPVEEASLPEAMEEMTPVLLLLASEVTTEELLPLPTIPIAAEEAAAETEEAATAAACTRVNGAADILLLL